MNRILSFLLLALCLTSCDLYMDNPDEARYYRTEKGYTQVETLELPDSAGTVEYQYRHTTIAITDEVEQYVVRIENDSTVIFVDGTPDYYLPVEGEVITSGFREKFPEGFCGKVIKREKKNDQWYCYCVSASFDEAFAHLDIDAHFPMTIHPGDTIVDADEYFSETEDSLSDDTVPQASRYKTRGIFDGVKYYKDNSKLLYIGIPDVTVDGSVLKVLHGTISVGGGLYAGYIVDFKYKHGPSKKTRIGFTLKGGVEFHAGMGLTLGGDFDLPVSIPIMGEKLDFAVVGANAGIYATPYIHVDKTIKAGVNIDANITLEIYYEAEGDNEGEFKTKVSSTKKRGEEVLKFTSFEDGYDTTMRVGLRIPLGLGIKPGPGFEVGGKLYWEFQQHRDFRKFTSVEDLFDTYIDARESPQQAISVKGDSYASFTADVLLASVGGTLTGVPLIATTQLFFNMYPELKQRYIYHTDNHRFNVGMSFYGLGVVCNLFPFKPKIRVIDPKTDEIVYVFNLDNKKGKDKEFESKKVYVPNIKYDKEYKIQALVTSGKDILLDEFKATFQERTVKVTDLLLQQTSKGKFTKTKNGIASNYTYRYRVRATLKLVDKLNIYKWRISPESLEKDFYCGSIEGYPVMKPTINNPTIDFYVYANKPVVKIYITPCLWSVDNPEDMRILDGNGKNLNMKYSADSDNDYGFWDEPTYKMLD